MSERHLVKCPHLGCDWAGSLPGSPDADSWRGLATNVLIVTFLCPRCQQEWQARVIGDDVESLPLVDGDDEMEPMVWPPLDIGVGD